jgi:hypothetical protein
MGSLSEVKLKWKTAFSILPQVRQQNCSRKMRRLEAERVSTPDIAAALIAA